MVLGVPKAVCFTAYDEIKRPKDSWVPQSLNIQFLLRLLSILVHSPSKTTYFTVRNRCRACLVETRPPNKEVHKLFQLRAHACERHLTNSRFVLKILLLRSKTWCFDAEFSNERSGIWCDRRIFKHIFVEDNCARCSKHRVFYCICWWNWATKDSWAPQSLKTLFLFRCVSLLVHNPFKTMYTPDQLQDIYYKKLRLLEGRFLILCLDSCSAGTIS